MIKETSHNVLDCGYIKLIEHWGSDERIIEAARMSTNKGFQSWEDHYVCSVSGAAHVNTGNKSASAGVLKEIGLCDVCECPMVRINGDARLLAHLYHNKHMTPFEMAGMVIEVKAPIFVFREWHRHRTQSYNEMSARYIPLPDDNYAPDVDDLVARSLAAATTANKQAAGTGVVISREQAASDIFDLIDFYTYAQNTYERLLRHGWPKELARLPVPVARYSRMRASANLRNWLGFLTLRVAPDAQAEIRQYANAVASITQTVFPRTYQLFDPIKYPVKTAKPDEVKTVHCKTGLNYFGLTENHCNVCGNKWPVSEDPPVCKKQPKHAETK